VEDFADLGTPVTKKSYHYTNKQTNLGPSPMRPNQLWTRLNNGPGATVALGQKPLSLVVKGVIEGPFE